MRGFNYSDLTGEILVFWKSGRLRVVLVCERWSQGEVQLYCLVPWFEIFGENIEENELQYKLKLIQESHELLISGLT